MGSAQTRRSGLLVCASGHMAGPANYLPILIDKSIGGCIVPEIPLTVRVEDPIRLGHRDHLINWPRK